MRLSTIVRIGALVLAGWLAGASALMGCAYAMSAVGPTSGDAPHHRVEDPAVTSDPAHHCCKKPDGSEEPARPPEKGQFEECCFRMFPATVGKGKPTQVQLTVSEPLAASMEPATSPEFPAGIEPAKEDSSGDYLLFRVLRI